MAASTCSHNLLSRQTRPISGTGSIAFEDVVPTVVDGVLKSVERVALAIVNRVRPAEALPAERIKELEAEVASLSTSVERLSATERELVERLTRGDSGD